MARRPPLGVDEVVLDVDDQERRPRRREDGVE
jgi:hypothetical protein